MIFHPRLPDDIVEFLCDLHNEFHEGASVSFMEVFVMVHIADGDWKSHCVSVSLPARLATGTACWQFLQETHKDKIPAYIPSQNFFIDARSTWN